MSNRFELVNLGQLGETGESPFSTMGKQFASEMVRKGWIPCGTYVNERHEVCQTFYLPNELEIDD